MSDSRSEKTPKTQPASNGGPPRPPKKTARDLSDSAPDGPVIDIPDPVVLKELAFALRKEPFKIVADVLELGQLKFEGDPINFETASTVAKRYGFYARHAV